MKFLIDLESSLIELHCDLCDQLTYFMTPKGHVSLEVAMTYFITPKFTVTFMVGLT